MKDVHSILGKISKARVITTGEGDKEKELIMLTILDANSGSVKKIFPSEKVVANVLHNDSSAAVEPTKLVGKYIAASFLAKGALLADGVTECDKDGVLLDNDTIDFMNKDSFDEFRSFNIES